MEDHELIPVHELCVHHKAEVRFVQLLEEYGLIQLTLIEEQSFVPATQLTELEKMIRLHYDLDVNIEGIDVIQHLLKKLEDAQEEICKLKSKIKFHQDFQD
jgi:hypothetical protein